ncbi:MULTISPECIES: flagellar hook-associated family protein [unclassified Methylobacterium]|jgi:flagellar hook-associated protein 3 FlgL|uniref:flagellar hook-associated family protein n=1 Tax=unclassified Methylobacterium TaxID=2615210 RepID=UPI00135479EB|nr:flagellar hook-associated family protein [Methylobacterium sp. 2A]MWV25092.1 flagellar hook-associated family protein [Methylobacterium sp. 2A]
MQTTFISTVNFLNTPRSTMNRLQADLDKANSESTNEGRYADVGLELGYRTGLTLDLRQGLDEIDAQVTRNGLTNVRVNSAYQALDRVRSDGEAFMATLTPGKLNDTSATTIAQAASSKLTALIGELNTQTGGQYLFGGINTAQVPIKDYETTSGTSDAKQAFVDAFKAKFGFEPGTQPGSSAITPTQMQEFLADGGPFAALFSNTAWKNWSTASDTPVRSEIARNETVNTSVSANVQPLRQLAMLYSLGSSIGLPSLSSTTQAVVYDKLRSLAGSATWGVTGIQADVGAVQARITTVGTQMGIQKNILQEGVKNLEYGDPIEAAARVKNLTTQLEISYSLTNQVNKLSLMDYVR